MFADDFQALITRLLFLKRVERVFRMLLVLMNSTIRFPVTIPKLGVRCMSRRMFSYVLTKKNNLITHSLDSALRILYCLIAKVVNSLLVVGPWNPRKVSVFTPHLEALV